ncbi:MULTISPECIES: redoxin family protein [Glaesserella]|uniref:Dihydroneopterin aldolase n=1 Tax=Glaesserella australis TaxID=2094024 RepID=A0A328C0F8_9PAST|nr:MULTISPECIES: redoxin family protein [Glaesserella]AUI66445.1 dihydroneopterin aldolase [Glaesserella sp. 15-184]RAL19341.1 dihydroneopterin aldolase [Glaesserella australis]
MKKGLLLLPLILLLGFVLFLGLQLNTSEQIAPSEDWRNKPFPEFRAKDLLDSQKERTKADLPKEPFILNVWASWCTWCIKEFPMLLNMQKQGVNIVGLTYVDRPDDARQALAKWGNPFSFIIDNYEHSQLLETLRINSAPVTYLIDHKGIIRYQQKGYSPDFEQDFMPKWLELKKEMP